MPLPPSAAVTAKLRAVNDGGFTIESDATSSDVTAAVVTHSVYVRVAADEEYRAYYGSTNWKTFVDSIVESADDYLYQLYGIDFVVQNYYATWDTADAGRSSCTIVNELKAEVPKSTFDMVLGFAKNSMPGSKGCHSGGWTVVGWHNSGNSPDERYAEWTVQRHEIGHNYGAPDRYPDTANVHPNDLMENQYTEPNYLCTKAGYDDYFIIYSNSDLHD